MLGECKMSAGPGIKCGLSDTGTLLGGSVLSDAPCANRCFELVAAKWRLRTMTHCLIGLCCLQWSGRRKRPLIDASEVHWRGNNWRWKVPCLNVESAVQWLSHSRPDTSGACSAFTFAAQVQELRKRSWRSWFEAGVEDGQLTERAVTPCRGGAVAREVSNPADIKF